MRPMSNYKIAVLGDKDSVLGFKALGLDVFPAESAEEAKRTLHALAKENYAVVYLTEGYAAHMEAELERYKDALTPAIILDPRQGRLPGHRYGQRQAGRGACRGRGYFVAPPAGRGGGAMWASPPTPITRWVPCRGGCPHPPAPKTEQAEGADHRQWPGGRATMKVAPTSGTPCGRGGLFYGRPDPRRSPTKWVWRGRRRRNGTSERSRLRGREGCAVCADEKEG